MEASSLAVGIVVLSAAVMAAIVIAVVAKSIRIPRQLGEVTIYVRSCVVEGPSIKLEYSMSGRILDKEYADLFVMFRSDGRWFTMHELPRHALQGTGLHFIATNPLCGTEAELTFVLAQRAAATKIYGIAPPPNGCKVIGLKLHRGTFEIATEWSSEASAARRAAGLGEKF